MKLSSGQVPARLSLVRFKITTRRSLNEGTNEGTIRIPNAPFWYPSGYTFAFLDLEDALPV
jgi:hypothetical protein